MQDNRDVIESGRVAWNTLSKIMDVDPELFESYTDFKEFYGMLCERLFTDEGERL
tara:strand:+ start:368 stop:532 length:165 start_codon:yes stop_codon:yes gene_type:complete